MFETKAHYEIERKFLIEFPDIEWLESLSGCEVFEISQTYLASDESEEVRVRRCKAHGVCEYFKTEKKKISGIKRIEIEKAISESDYTELLKYADPERKTVEKTRYRFSYEGQCFEIDIYPHRSDIAIAETELNDENASVAFPEKLRVIKEVTDDDSYKNAQLAKRKTN